MKKTITSAKPAADGKQPLLPSGHKYVLLSDGTVARKCKPMQIASTAYYNLRVNGDTIRVRADALVAFLAKQS